MVDPKTATQAEWTAHVERTLEASRKARAAIDVYLNSPMDPQSPFWRAPKGSSMRAWAELYVRCRQLGRVLEREARLTFERLFR